MLNVKPSNLVFLKTYTTEFDEIIIKFTDETGWPLEIEDLSNKIWHCLSINKNDTLFELSNATIFYRIKNKKICQRIYGFLSFARKNKKQLFDTGVDALKTTSEKVVHKTSKFVGNKIADAVTKSNDDKMVKQEPVEEIIIPLGKRDGILNNLRQVIL